MMERAVTVLPQPDSPTMPSTSPLPTSRSTPSTARRSPRDVVNSVFRPRTTRIGSNGLPPSPGIEDVPETVSEEIDRDGEDEQDESWHDDGPGIRRKAGGIAHHDQVPQLRDEQVARVEADEIEGGKDLGDHPEIQGDLDEYRGERVRKNVFQHDSPVRRTRRPRGLDKLQLLHGKRLSPHETCIGGPPKGEEDGIDREEIPPPECESRRDHKHKERDRVRDVRRSHEDFVEQTAAVPGEHSDQTSDQSAKADDERGGK